MKALTIIGGGLAGLSLGIALRKREVPVTLYEAGTFPRHKVCGEFIAGVSERTLEELGITEHLADAGSLRRTAWYYREALGRVEDIPKPALSVSRYRLDQRLANAFTDAGGELHSNTRFKGKTAEGQVWAAGRQATRTEWIGLKAHYLNLPLESDLELHLGAYAYAGASPVEADRVNVCGLFRKRPEISGRKEELLPAYLKACGMGALAAKVAQARLDPESVCGVAAVDFSRSHQSDERLFLGDQFTVIPPFTGNGMSMAFEAAALATEPLTAWAGGKLSWTRAVKAVNLSIRRKFMLRVGVSRIIHPFIYHPRGQKFLVAINRYHILPFKTLYHALH